MSDLLKKVAGNHSMPPLGHQDILVKPALYHGDAQTTAEKIARAAHIDLTCLPLHTAQCKLIKEAILSDRPRYNHDMNNTLMVKIKGREVKINFVTEAPQSKLVRHRDKGRGFAHIEGDTVRMRRSVAAQMQVVGPTLRVRDRDLNVQIMDDAEADELENAVNSYIQQQGKAQKSDKDHGNSSSHMHKRGLSRAHNGLLDKSEDKVTHKVTLANDRAIENEAKLKNKKHAANEKAFADHRFEKNLHQLQQIVKEQTLDFERNQEEVEISVHKFSELRVA